jgi:hypothetical protein
VYLHVGRQYNQWADWLSQVACSTRSCLSFEEAVEAAEADRKLKPPPIEEPYVTVQFD